MLLPSKLYSRESVSVRSASSELTHVLNKYGVPAVLTHGFGWLCCMMAVFLALDAGLDIQTVMSFLPADFKV